MHIKLARLLNKINNWRKQRISNANFLILAAAIVGILGGLAASLLKKLTHFIAFFLQNQLHWEYKYYLYLFFPLIGILLTVLYIRTFIRKSKFHHGLSPVIFNISRKQSKLDFHNMYSQIITSALTVGFGGSAGLEAPIVSSGSAIGSNIGRFFGLNYRETTLLLACGAAAGIAGAFNSPVAGMIFAIEVLLPQFSIPAFIPLLIAAALSSVVSRLLYSEPLFILVTEGWVTQAFGFYILLGITAGIFSIYFVRLNSKIHQWFGAIKNPYNKIWIGGICLGIMIAIFPALYGEGYMAIQGLLNGQYLSLLQNSIFTQFQDISWVILLFALFTLIGKSIASSITLSSGGNGGMFGPSLVVGGLLGFVFSYGLNLTGLVDLNITNFIVVGMAAALSGIMHAPLTAIFLIAEITGGYALMVPLMMVTAIAYFINKSGNKYSIYTKSLAESGELMGHDINEGAVWGHMKLRYQIEKDFITLLPDETPLSRKKDIIHTHRNIFPVIDKAGQLLGIIQSEALLEILINQDLEKINYSFSKLMQPMPETVSINTEMFEIIRKMDNTNIRIYPVIDTAGRYLGFISRAGILNKYRSLLKRNME